MYAASRLIIREYQPHLDKLEITYSQYLVLMVLWEKDSIAVSEIAQTLILNTNTVTPILKRIEAQGLITAGPDLSQAPGSHFRRRYSCQSDK